jgi:hypothetical protein
MKEEASKISRVDYESLWDKELEKIDMKLEPIDNRKYVPEISKQTLMKAIAPYKKKFSGITHSCC